MGIQNLLYRFTSSKFLKNEFHGYARASDHRFAHHNRRV